MYASDTLTSCDTAATALGRSYTTWSVLEASGITYFCATTGNAPLNQPSTRYSETCIEIDANGVLQSRARIHIVQPGLDLIATN